MNDALVCPDCKTVVARDYGLPGVVCHCPTCRKEWIKMLGRLVSREEFHKRVELEQ